jgi:hypothetical protein
MALSLDLELLPATILAGASLSNAVALGAKTPVGIIIPAAWTAAALTVLASCDGGTTWASLWDEATGNEVSLPSAASRFIRLNPLLWNGVIHIQLRSGTLASPIVQVAQAVLQIAVRGSLT